MTDAQVRDEAVTLFLAGHETTALALTYALYLLATHPEAQVRLADEIERVLGGRSPGLGDLDKLALTETVVLESMRLYPPAWGMAGRRTTRRDRRLRVPQGRRVRDVAVGRAPRRAQLRGRRRLQARATGTAISSGGSRASPTFPSVAARAFASATASR